MAADDLDENITALRQFAKEVVEAYAGKIRKASDPDKEWENTVTKFSLLAADASQNWFCILPNTGSPSKTGFDCKPLDPATCVNICRGTPTTSCPPSGAAKLDY